MRPERRDNRNRILVTGETQRNDGRYVYRYIDTDGIRREISSWRLVGSDVTPEGKEERQALRDLEKEIRERIDRENAIAGDSPTVLVTVRRYANVLAGPEKGKVHNMCDVAERLENEGFEKGRLSERIKSVAMVLKNGTAADASRLLGATAEEILKAKQLNAGPVHSAQD